MADNAPAATPDATLEQPVLLGRPATSGELTPGAKALSQAMQAGALQLTGDLLPRDAPNFVFSPWAMQTVLSMLYAGAAAETQAEMQKALGFTQAPAQLGQAFGELSGALAAALEEREGVSLHTASRLFVDSSISLEPNVATRLRQDFAAPIAKLDIANHPEEARVAINAWVYKQTAEHIDGLLPKGSVKPSSSLVSAAALHLAAAWPKPLSTDSSKKFAFHAEGGAIVHPAQVLHKELHVPYVDTPTYTAARLYYKNPAFSLLLALPKGDPRAFAKALSQATFTALWNGMKPQQVALRMPAFELQHALAGNIKEALRRRGMQRAFTSRAQFNIATNTPTALSEIFEKAYVRVDENGTEAAAASATIMMATSARVTHKPIPFIVDRPFLFFIVHEASQTIFFVGFVGRP